MKRYKMFCICLCAFLLTSCGERKEPEVGKPVFIISIQKERDL